MVRQELVAEKLVSPVKKKIFKCKKEDRGILVVTVLTMDDVDYPNDRCRIQFIFILQLYTSSGARLAAFFEKDIGIIWRVSCCHCRVGSSRHNERIAPNYCFVKRKLGPN